MSETIKNSLYNILKTFSTMLFPLITFTYVSRIFLSDGMGRINFTKSVVSIFTMIAMLGIQNYGTREGARIRNNRSELSRLYKELLIINVISAIVSYILLFAGVIISSKLNGYSDLIFINSFLIGSTVLGVEWLYFSVEDYKYIAIRTSFVQMLSLILLLIFVREKDDITKYVLIQTLSTGGAYFFNFIHARKYVDLSVKCKLNLRRHMKPILYLFAMTVFIQIFTDMDTAMLGIMADERSVGLYTAAYKISGVIAAVISAATAVIIPRMAYVIENKQYEKAEKLLRDSLNFTLMIGLPIAAGTFIFSKTFLLILSGSDFAEAEMSSQIMAFRGILSPINGIFVLNFLIPYKKDKQCMLITAIAAVLNIIANILLIPVFKQNGAAAATVISEGVELFAELYFVSHIVSIRGLVKGLWKYAAALLAMILSAACICLFVEDMIIELIVSVIVCACVYFAALKILKCEFTESAENMIKSYFKRK